MLAEYAACKFLNVYPDMSPKTDKDPLPYIDFTFGATPVNCKSGPEPTSNLLVQGPERKFVIESYPSLVLPAPTNMSDRPKIADLFRGGGGAGKGLSDAGFEVVGFDINPQPHYPFEFHQADAMEADLSGFDAAWASPPCQTYSRTKSLYPSDGLPDLLAATRDKLKQSGLPWIIENVVGAPFEHYIELCGMMFGLKTYRHRRFEASWTILPPAHPRHTENVLDHRYDRNWKGFVTVTGGGNAPLATMKAAMGIDWMTRAELTQAVPPVYAEFLGKALLNWLPHKEAVSGRPSAETQL